MNERQLSPIEDQNEIKRLERNSLILAVIATASATLGGLAALIFDFSNPATIFPIAIAGMVAILLIRSDRFVTGNWIIIAVSVISTTVEVIQRSGEGVSRGVIALVFIGGYALAAMPRSMRGRMLLLGLFVVVGIIALDIFGPAGRPVTPQTPTVLVFTLFTILVYSYFIAREFPNLDLRTKISFGILVTGGLAVGVLSFFAVTRSGQLIDNLSGRVETSVLLLAEDQLVTQTETEADSANRFFEEIAGQARRMAEYRTALQGQQAALSQGNYWNAEEKLRLLEDGKYGNPSTDVSSVFVPSTVIPDALVFSELNTSAYLDFLAPQLLDENPALLAVYYIDEEGVVRYYPNIELASLLPHDFDATQRPYYGITTPLSNPQRTTRWTVPYVDAAGGGLVVTVASPVYIRDRFSGVVAADVQLSKLAERISSIEVGQTGYAFMLDDAGRIISMPADGYQLFGFDPDNLPAEDYSDQTVLGAGPEDLQPIIQNMLDGGSGLNTININGVETYISYSRIPANDYSLAIIVPTSEMQTAIVATRNEIENQTRSAIRTAGLLLGALLLIAVIAGLGLSQVIAAPVIRLTETANQILDGNLEAQAEITTKDEIGTLAQAFNAVTTQLRETLAGLEKTIEERTSELSAANLNIERRARQFQSISQVARTISSTHNFDSLLTQITTVISREFGFYHVGVFLLDTAREYAVLSAANSEGGQTMLARGHRLKVGEKGLVGFVSNTGKPRVALDTGADAVFFNNPDLPETRSEIALPLLAGDNVIGVLDVQSTEANAFSQEDIDILSTLADQVSIAIQNARQNEETQKALAESKALSQQFVQSGWQNFTKRQNLAGIRHTGAKATLLYTKKAKGNGQSVETANQLKPKGRGAVLSIPIKLRGEVIGTVDVKAPDTRQWDQDEMDIVTAIIERAAIAMENARLLTESQRRAAKERTIGEIAAKISAQSEIEDLLKTAAQELTRSIPGTEIAIQFRKDETE
ncbi:MAG TPA: GAF domain-containing protein [Anaerolineales bacterium]|nr:GAF domain-containing protein [Anaerolineales bacterium]